MNKKNTYVKKTENPGENTQDSVTVHTWGNLGSLKKHKGVKEEKKNKKRTEGCIRR